MDGRNTDSFDSHSKSIKIYQDMAFSIVTCCQTVHRASLIPNLTNRVPFSVGKSTQDKNSTRDKEGMNKGSECESRYWRFSCSCLSEESGILAFSAGATLDERRVWLASWEEVTPAGTATTGCRRSAPASYFQSVAGKRRELTEDSSDWQDFLSHFPFLSCLFHHSTLHLLLVHSFRWCKNLSKSTYHINIWGFFVLFPYKLHGICYS